MTGYQYECFCTEYLKKEGYTNIRQTSASGDQGLDIIATKKGIKYGFQCKYYSTSVGNRAIQEVFSGIHYYGCDRAIVMTNSTFTDSARNLAYRTGVELWEGIVPDAPSRSEKANIVIGLLIIFLAYVIIKFLSMTYEQIIDVINRSHISGILCVTAIVALVYEIYIIRKR